MGTVIAITSGKGGTGKTSITGGVAASLAQMGRRVLCIDMDIGLRNLDISLGLNDRALMDFSDVALGRCPLARAVVAQESGREVIRRAKELLIRTAALSEPEAYRAVTAFAKERGLSPEEAAQLILDRGGLPK